MRLPLSVRTLPATRLGWRAGLLAAIWLLATPYALATNTLVSHVPGSAVTTGDAGLGETPEGSIRLYALARDSGDVAFTTSATNLIAGGLDANGALDVVHWDRASDNITLVSHSVLAVTASCNGESRVLPGGISADGRYVVYTSTCSDLDGTLGSHPDGSVYLWDRNTNTNVLLSQGVGFSPPFIDPLEGEFPLISEDGSTIYYRGVAADAGLDTDLSRAGIRVDRATLTKTLVTHAAGLPGVPPNATLMDGRNRGISADGRYIAHSSRATNLVAGQVDDGTNQENLFLYDTVTQSSQLVTHVAGDPLTPASGPFGKFDLNTNIFGIALSADGGTLAYSSSATNLIAGFVDANGTSVSDLYVYDRVSQLNTLASHAAASPVTGASGGLSRQPVVSDDGALVAYTSGGENLVAGQITLGLGSREIFLWARASNSNRMVSHDAASAVTESDGEALNPAMDRMGERIAFQSFGGTLVNGLVDAPGYETYLWMADTDTVRLVSHTAASPLAADNGDSISEDSDRDRPQITGDGDLVLHPTFATNVVAGQIDGNGGADLFLFDASLPTVAFAVAASSAPEDSVAVVAITVTLSQPFGLDVTVPFTVSGTANDPADYSLLTLSPLTIPAGDTSVDIELTLQDDTVFEGDETVVITLGTPINAELGAPSVHTFTIVENDPPPVVSFALPSSSVTEGDDHSVAVVLDSVAGVDVTVAYGFSFGTTATNPDDFSPLTPSPITIPAGSLSTTIDLSTVADGVDEGDEFIELALFAPSNATLGVPSLHTVTLIDAVALPAVRFALAASSVTEGAPASITVQLSAPGAADVTVPFSISGTAPADDFDVLTASPLVIPAGSTSATVEITTTDNELNQPSRTVVLTLGAPINATPDSPGIHTLTILDDDLPPTVAFVAAASSVTEGVGTTAIVLQLSAPSAFTISVPYTLSGTASRPDDYTLISPTTLTFSPGQTEASIQLSIVDDALDEPDETVILTLGAPTNASLGDPSQHTLTLVDNDPPPQLRFDSATSSVGEGQAIAVSVSLSAPSAFAISVPFTTGGSAVAPDDYSVLSDNPITIPPGATGAVIQLATIADGLSEGDETILLTLGTPTNAILASPFLHTVTLIESDPPPTVRFTSTASSVVEGEIALIEVVLSGPSAQAVNVPFTLGGSATAGSDYPTPVSPLVIPAGALTATLSIATVDDALAEADETVIIQLGTPANAVLVEPFVHTLTVLDNDPAPTAVFEIGELSLLEGESAALVVRLSGPAGTDLELPFTVGGTATEPDDYTITSSPLLIPAGATEAALIIETVADDIVERSETVVITLGGTELAKAGTEQAKAASTLIITILDPSPQVNFITTQATLSEGDTVQIMVQLDQPLVTDALVEFTASSVHGEPGATPDDYEMSASPILIPAGQTLGVIEFRALRDNEIEVEECLLLSLQISVDSVPGPRSDSLIVIRNVGGTADGGGAMSPGLLILALCLLSLRGRWGRAWLTAGLIGAASAASAATASDSDWPNLLQPKDRHWWAPGEVLAIEVGPQPERVTDEYLLELDAIDVTGVATRTHGGQVIELHPPRPLNPGVHRLRLVLHSGDGELREIGAWQFEVRQSEGFRSARAAHATALQGNGVAFSSEDIDSKRDYNGNASLRLDGNADTGLGHLAAHANLLTDSNRLRTGQDMVQLGDFRVTGSDGTSQMTAGNFAIAPIGGQSQRDFAYDGGSRRGLSLSTRLPIASATVTGYTFGSEPVNGFRRGFGFSAPGNRFTGGLIRATPYAGRAGQVGLSLGYLEGVGQRGGTAIFSAEENLLIQTRGVDGNVGNAVLDTRWLDGVLSFRAEYARSERHFPLIRGLQLDPVTDDARSYVVVYRPAQGLMLGGDALQGHITFDHQEIGTAFRSIGAPGGALDVVQDRISAGLQYRTVSLDLSAARSQDNVADAPFPTTGADNIGLQLSWSPQWAPESLPSFLQSPSMSLGVGEDRRKTRRLPESMPDAGRVDTTSGNIAASLSFAQPLGGWSVSYSGGRTDDDTGQSQATRNRSLSLDASFQFGANVSLSAQIFGDESRQLALTPGPEVDFFFEQPGSTTRTESAALSLQWQILPGYWALSLGTSANRARTADGSLESQARQADFNSTWTWRAVNFFLRGSYQNGRDRSVFLPYEDEFGEPSPPEINVSRRESYQGFVGFSFNFRAGH